MSKQSIWSYIEPYEGCQIRVNRNKYYHHGIYINPTEVIEFGSEVVLSLSETRDITVDKTTLKDFLQDGYLEVREYSLAEKIKKNSNKKVVQKAISKIGEKGYDFLKNNCEHFSNDCVFNQKYSEQIDNLKRKLVETKWLNY